MSKLKLKLKSKKLKANIKFNYEIAEKSSNTSYYKAQAENQKNIQHIEYEKLRLATPKWDRVTYLLNYYKNLGATANSSAGKVLMGIYNKNIEACKYGMLSPNSNLISVVAKVETLMLAYKAIKGNKGAMAPKSPVSESEYNSYSETQKLLYINSVELPDGISLWHLQVTSKLLRTGKYIWGTSTRVYIDKPGQPGRLRPITMPPFLDKIVQKAIELTLNSIYEPYFEKMNRSFGFRPNKGVHDAITCLTSKLSTGMRTAIEGDIEAAFDTVNKELLLEILGKKITDKKFLDLLKQRLNYEYLEKETGKRFRPKLGIPQGGIDSPYLFNIYMYELDLFVHNELAQVVKGLNEKFDVDRKTNISFTSLKAKKAKYIRWMRKAKAELKKLPLDKNLSSVKRGREKIFKIARLIRINEHRKNRVSSATITQKYIRFLYARYADDWIILTNGNVEVANHLKNKIAEFLETKLKLKLSQNKTLITNITKEPAKFLGFELKVSARGALYRKPVDLVTANKRVGYKFSIKKHIVQKKSGLLVWAQPDKHRMINRFFMKGYCTESGFPITMPWLSCLEAHAIVERYNSVIRGLANYYLPVIRNRAKIHRWIYILRYSCLKTLAQKYKCTIRKIFKRFGHNLNSKSNQTIRIRVVQTIKGQNYYKDWVLLTYRELVNNPNIKKAQRDNDKTFWRVENGKLGDYPLKLGKMPRVTNSDFLDTIKWVSWRTMASLNMPCANCGTEDNVHQHHIKHIRKRGYTLIPEAESYQQIMALRNRKQIPLCDKCHLDLVHGGKYDGPKLINLAPKQKLVDNRVIHVESFVKPGIEYHAKTLVQKGWQTL